MTATGHDTLETRSTLAVNGKDYAYYSLSKAAEQLGDIARLPISMKVLLENLLRFEDEGFTIGRDDLQAVVDWQNNPVTGSDLEATLQIDGEFVGELLCAQVAGTVTVPVMIPLLGSTLSAMPLDLGPSPAPEDLPLPSEIGCP